MSFGEIFRADPPLWASAEIGKSGSPSARNVTQGRHVSIIHRHKENSSAI